MEKELRKTYFTLILPAVALSVLLFVLQYFGLREGGSELPSRFLMTFVFVLAIATGVALPIFLRAYFFGKVKQKRYLTSVEFLTLQKKILYVISVTPYLALLAGYLNFETFYFAGTVLAAIYAVYYHYPSNKKIQFDKKVFMVKNESD